jgi:hypothetical protein
MQYYILDIGSSIPGRARNFPISHYVCLAIQWVPEALSSQVRHPEHETNYSPPSRTKAENTWSSSTVSIVTTMGYMTRVRFSAGHVHTGCGAHPAFYPMDSIGSFLGCKVAGV